MKKLALALITTSLALMMPAATAANSVVRITAPIHQTFSGEFRNDDLVEKLTPAGQLGRLVFRSVEKNRTWVIDPALVDEILSMTGPYTLATGADTSGTEIALNWMMQLRKVSADNDVVALAYGNPDVRLAKKLAASKAFILSVCLK